MTAIRFDASANAVAEEDPKLAEEWGSYADSIWYLTDRNSNGRWLFVDHAEPGNGVPLGIGRGVYTKYLSAAATRSLAAALLVAADEAEAAEAAREREAQAQRMRECEENGGHQWGPPPLPVRHATSVVRSDGTWLSFRACRRCDYATWLDASP